jgi:hypothetical protein
MIKKQPKPRIKVETPHLDPKCGCPKKTKPKVPRIIGGRLK